MNRANDIHRKATSFAEQFESMSGLQQWKRWLAFLTCAIIYVLVCFILDFEILGSFSLLDFGIYSLLFTFAGVTLFISFRDAEFINHQTQLATEQVDMMLELNDITEFLETAEKSIFRSHLESLYKIFLVHHEINQDNLIEILSARLLARNRIVELFSSILITLGLIGTVVGLILMTNDLGEIIGNAGSIDSSILMERIAGNDGPLGSLGVAFYTTLIGGILGGVVLRILSNVVDTNILKYTAHIAELTEVNILPFMRQMAKDLDAAGYYNANHDEETQA